MKALLIVALLVAITAAQDDESRFRQLSARELREFELIHNPELLRVAARTAETIIIILDSPLSGAFVQEGVNANIDCFPWLSNFPGGQVTWLNQRFVVNQETGEVTDVEDQTEIQTPLGGRFIIGGDFDRWLNITATNIIQGREDADHGNYTCRVCTGVGTPLEDCHDATVTVYLPGAPPMINSTTSNEPDDVGPSGELTYRVGADFCIDREQMPPTSFMLECDILDRDLAAGIPGPIPTPMRIWVKDGIIVYNTSDGESTVNAITPEFFMASPANMLLMTGLLQPQSFLPLIDGSLTFITTVVNSSAAGIAEVVARSMLFDAFTGEWTCIASNAYGTDMATSNIRECGLAPVFPVCSSADGIVFPMRDSVVSVGCDTVCIREGISVTLDCTVTAGDPPINYEWRDDDGNLLSNSPLLRVSRPDNYTCQATNLDAPENREVTLLAFSPQVSYMGNILDEFTNEPRGDNGCNRLSSTEGIEADACIFLGETLELDCRTDDDTELNIMDLGGIDQGANFNITATVDNVGSVNGTFPCSLMNIEGDCGRANRQFTVQVFDPARINREDDLGIAGALGVGRFNEVQVITPANMSVTIFCPTSGIPMPTDTFSKVTLDPFGMAMETVITGDEDGLSLSQPMGVLHLTIDNLFGDTEGTYVCRTSNIAGQDAAAISLTTRPLMSVWSVGDWTECDNPCAQAVRRRSVVCRQMRAGDKDGRIVPDTFCNPDTEPASEETCEALFFRDCLLDPVWIPGSFGPCSRDCKGGFRQRRVLCQVPLTGEVRPDNECFSLLKPVTFEFCPVTCCVTDELGPYCKALGGKFCNMPAIQQQCCWSCGLSSIP